MARSAPSVDRVIGVLNFFAEHPDHGFSLTDIIRTLQLNRATCHGLLNALADAGYLYRDAAKKYRMGPALAAIGRIAHQSFAPVEAARDQMRRLADTHDLVCFAASRVGSEMIFLEKMVSRSHLEPQSGRAPRHMIAPPGGSSFIAWAPQTEIDAWLDAFDPPLDAQGRSNVLEALGRIRALRFSHNVDYGVDTRDPLAQMAAGAKVTGGAGFVPSFARPIEPETAYPVTYISSPVLGASREVLFTISLTGFGEPISGSRVLELGSDLRRSTEKISNVLSPGSNRR